MHENTELELLRKLKSGGEFDGFSLGEAGHKFVAIAYSGDHGNDAYRNVIQIFFS